MWKWIVSLTTLCASPAYGVELGDAVEEAVALHLTGAGLAKIGDMVEGLLPETIEVEAGAGTFECGESDANPLSYDVNELVIRLSADDVQVTTDAGRLELNLFATLWSDSSQLDVSGDCAVLQDLDETCDIALPVTCSDTGKILGEIDRSIIMKAMNSRS